MATTPPTLNGFTVEYACNIARRAGEIQKELFKPFGVAREIKGDKTPVTEADKRINRMLIEIVRADFPEICIQGEEESDLTDSDWKVVCDPIDGTFPYVWGMPITTFMMALLYEGQPVLAVIYDPFSDRMYTAEAGKGAFMNGDPIKVSQQTDTSTKPVVGIVSWPGCPYDMLRIAQRLEEQGFLIVSFCSIGYMIAPVATGEFVATVFPANTAHDSAAGDLIIREAGGIATSILGEVQTYEGKVNGHIFSNGHLHQQILETVLMVQGTKSLTFPIKRGRNKGRVTEIGS